MLLAGVAVMVRDKYAVRLALEQREELRRLIRVGKRPARVIARARILLKSDDGWPAPQVAEALDVALGTVYRVKQRFTEEWLAGVLKDRSQANRRWKLDDRGEAHLIALACSPPPAGHAHWTLLPRQGRPLRRDYEYRRESTRNLFLTCEPLAGWRHVAVTQRRTMQDFAQSDALAGG